MEQKSQHPMHQQLAFRIARYKPADDLALSLLIRQTKCLLIISLLSRDTTTIDKLDRRGPVKQDKKFNCIYTHPFALT